MGSKTTQSSQAVTIPPEVLARYNSVNATAEKAATTPFQTYGGEFVAPVNAQQSQGIAGINAAANQSQPTYQQAIAGTQSAYYGAQPYNQGATAYALGAGQNVDPSQVNGAAINQFMSPYLQNVAGSEANLLNQNNQQAMAGQLGNAITSGAFGGDRAGIAAANLNQQNQLANANIYSNILNTGYNQALGAAQQQQGVNLGAQQANRAAYGNAAQLLQGIGQQQYGQGLGAAQQTAALGQGAQESALQGAQAQIGAGTLQQQTAQAGDTATYNQFLQQQSYPFQTAQFLANIAEGTGALSGSTTTTNQPGGFFGSDERLKENIEPIGMTFDGQTIHKYNYKGDDKRKQFGLIAQEVERHHPEAVGLAGGYKTVDYDKATPFTSSAATSEGGSVGLGHAGEGYAYGGPPTPPGVSSVDLQGILQAQSNMYAPYAGKSGLYGGSGGGPYGGAGHVPPPSGSVSHLAVASGLPAASNKTAMQSIHDTVQASKAMQEAWRGKKDAKGNVEQYGLRDLFSKKPPAADSAAAPAAAPTADPAADPAAQTGLNVGSGAHGELTSGDMATGAAQRDASMSRLSAAQPEVAADNYTPSAEDFQGFAARGGLIQHHFADGGGLAAHHLWSHFENGGNVEDDFNYPVQKDKLDIPEVASNRGLAVAHGSSGSQSSPAEGLGSLMNGIGSILKNSNFSGGKGGGGGGNGGGGGGNYYSNYDGGGGGGGSGSPGADNYVNYGGTGGGGSDPNPGNGTYYAAYGGKIGDNWKRIPKVSDVWRVHRADGGAMPYQESGGGLDIPAVTPQQHSLQTPGSGLSGQQSGMSDVMDVAKMAAMFAARGGAVHREGHAYGGVPGANPAIPGFGASGGGAPSTGGAKGMIGGAPSTGGAKGMTTGPMHPAIQHALDTLHRADGGRIHKAVAGSVDANGNPIDPTTPDAQPSFLQELGSRFRHPIDTITNAPHVIGEGLNNLFSSPAVATGGLGQAAPSSASTERPRLPNGQEDLRSDWSRFWDNGTSNYDAARAKQRHELVAADQDKINPGFGVGFLTPKPSKEEIAAAAPKPAGLSPAPAAAAPAVASKPAFAAPTSAGLTPSNVAVPKPAEKNEYGPSSFVDPPSKDYEGEGHPSPLAKPTGLAAGAPSNASPVQEDLKKALLPHSPMGVAASGAPPPPTENFVSKALSFLKSKGEDGQNHWDSSKIIPLITGIAQMGITPTRSLGVAASAGVLAGTQAILPTQQAQADIASTNIGNAAEVAALPSAAFHNGIVDLADGTTMLYARWLGLPEGSRPAVRGQSQAQAGIAGLPYVPNLTQGSSVKPTPLTRGSIRASDASLNAFEQEAQRNAVISNGKGNGEDLGKYLSAVGTSAESARTVGTNLGYFADNINQSADGEMGPLNQFKNDIYGKVNQLIHSLPFLNETQKLNLSLGDSGKAVDRAVEMEKLSAVLSSAGASMDPALRSTVEGLLTQMRATPNREMTKNAAQEIVVNMMVAKQPAIDEQLYARDASLNARSPNLLSPDSIRRQFHEQDYPPAQYQRDKTNLLGLMREHPSWFHDAISGSTTKNEMAAIENQYPGVTRYLENR